MAALNLTLGKTTGPNTMVSFNFRINILSFLIDDTNILNDIFFHDFCLGTIVDWEHIPGIDDAAYAFPG